MNTYESKQKQLLRSQIDVYNIMTDMRRLQPIIEALPEEQKNKINLQDIQFSQDSVSFKVQTLGNVFLRIVDKDEPKTIKFGADNFPVHFNFWIQFVGVADTDTRMKLTLKADIPLMLKPMIGNKLSDGIERMADMIAMALNR